MMQSQWDFLNFAVVQNKKETSCVADALVGVRPRIFCGFEVLTIGTHCDKLLIVLVIPLHFFFEAR